jgi:uncharacterized protein
MSAVENGAKSGLPGESLGDRLARQRPPLRRRLLGPAVRLGLLYIGLLVVLMLLENSLLFQATTASQYWAPPPAGIHPEDAWVQTPQGKMHGWYFEKPGATGALLYAHGNAGNLSFRGPAAVDLMTALDVSVLIFDYPGYGKSEGKPSEAACYAAADAMYDWLTDTKHIPGEQIILYGKSLGGGVATELATRRPHRALVLAKTFTSVPDVAAGKLWFLPVHWLVRNRFDNLAKIARCPRPIAIAAGDCDELMPLWMGQKLYETATSPKRYFLLKDCSHNGMFPPTFLPELAAFLREAAPLP